jgi:2-dehydropantoate 2-reductase
MLMPERWHVLGAGAIGCLFATALQRAGCPTTLLLRQDYGTAPVTVTVEREGSASSADLPVSLPSDSGHISHLLVTTKAQDVCAAALSVAHRLDSASQVLLLSNGMGFAEQLQASLPLPAYFFGTTTEGAYRASRWHIHHAGRGLTRVGRPGCALPPPWFEQWSQAIQPSSWDADIEHSLWLKLAINCAINPLSALHRCRNGELAGPELAPRLEGLCEEIMQVSAAAGLGAVTADLPEQVAAVIRATADNRSSMLQDVLAGRATEIEYISGHLLQLAARHGVAAPQNESLYRSICRLGN